ncbi:MAG: hypothetical protein KC503_03780 [Myxococcales bacterium]|nr:hypothetical protein [Myxococcales bacterium]
MRRSLLPISLVAVLAACPSSKPNKPTVAPPPPERVISAFRVADRMPAEVTYAGLARSLSVFVDGLRAALRPLRVLERSLTPDRIDAVLRRSLGWNPLDLGELDDAGFDLDASVGFFSVGVEPTALLPIKSKKRLEKFLAARTTKLKVFIRRVKGRTHTSVALDSSARLSWVVLDGYLAMHISMRPAGVSSSDWKPTASWFDAIASKLPRGRSLSGSRALAWVLEGAGKRRDLAAYLDPPRFSKAAKAFGRAMPSSCEAHRAELSELPRVGAVALFKKARVDVALRAELGKSAAAALVKMTDGAPALPASIHDKAPLRLQIAFDANAIAQLSRRIGNRRCGPIFEVARELRYLPALFSAMPVLRYSAGRLAAALLKADERGQGTLHIEGAALIAPASDADSKRIAATLTLTGKPETIANKQVRVLSPSVNVAQTMRVFADATRIALTSGEGLMQALLAAPLGGASKGPRTLLSFHATPSGVADLRAPLKLVENRRPSISRYSRISRYRRHYRYGRYAPLDALGHLLSSYKQLDIDVKVDPDRGELRAGLRYSTR